MIKGLNISKNYKKFELHPTSIEIYKGEIVALIGENGAGKSTLIKCMCGVIDADEGQLEVDDQVVKKLDDVLVLGFMNQDQNVYNEIKIRDLTNFVKDVMKKIIDIHGQQDNQLLLDSKYHIKYLDNFIGKELKEIKEQYMELYNEYKKLKNELQNNYGDEKEKERRLDLLKYQLIKFLWK